MSGQGTKACILDCPICTNIFEDPRILPCQHTTCEKCLSSYIKDIIQKEGKRPMEFPCPVCQRKTKLREASSFQKNLTIVALLDSKSLSAKLRKASAKKKTNAVTIETQTSREDTFPQPNNVPTATSQDLSARDVKNTKDRNKLRNKTTYKVDQEKGKWINIVTYDPKNGKKTARYNVSILLFIINCSLLEKLPAIYLLLVLDLVLIVVAFYMPFLVSMTILLDTLFCYPLRSSLLEIIQNRVIKKKKWWHIYLFTNIEWALSAVVNIFWLLLCLLVVNLFYTFYSAISNTESLFTIDVFMENFILRLLGSVYSANNLNLELADKFRGILHWFF